MENDSVYNIGKDYDGKELVKIVSTGIGQNVYDLSYGLIDRQSKSFHFFENNKKRVKNDSDLDDTKETTGKNSQLDGHPRIIMVKSRSGGCQVPVDVKDSVSENHVNSLDKINERRMDIPVSCVQTKKEREVGDHDSKKDALKMKKTRKEKSTTQGTEKDLFELASVFRDKPELLLIGPHPSPRIQLSPLPLRSQVHKSKQVRNVHATKTQPNNLSNDEEQPTARDNTTKQRKEKCEQPTAKDNTTQQRKVKCEKPTARDNTTQQREVKCEQPTARDNTTQQREEKCEQPTARDNTTQERKLKCEQPTARYNTTQQREVKCEQSTSRDNTGTSDRNEKREENVKFNMVKCKMKNTQVTSITAARVNPQDKCSLIAEKIKTASNADFSTKKSDIKQKKKRKAKMKVNIKPVVDVMKTSESAEECRSSAEDSHKIMHADTTDSSEIEAMVNNTENEPNEKNKEKLIVGNVFRFIAGKVTKFRRGYNKLKVNSYITH